MYTIGIKKWWGYEKHSVSKHSWENFRFIFDLADGSQLIVPGFKAAGVKVFADFHEHVELINRAHAAEQLREAAAYRAEVERQELEEFKRSKALEAQLNPGPLPAPFGPSAPQVAANLNRPAPQQSMRAGALSFSPDAEETYGHVNPEVMKNVLQRVRGILPDGTVDA